MDPRQKDMESLEDILVWEFVPHGVWEAGEEIFINLRRIVKRELLTTKAGVSHYFDSMLDTLPNTSMRCNEASNGHSL